MAILISGVVAVPAAVAEIVYFEEDFSDNGAGWLLGPTWQIGPATESGGHAYGYADPASDHSPSDDDGVAGQNIGGNMTHNGTSCLISPRLNLSQGEGRVILSFWRWLNAPWPYYAPAATVDALDLSVGSPEWQNVWTGEMIRENEWTFQLVDLTPVASAEVHVRFCGNRHPSITMSGWNLDDVTISDRLGQGLVTAVDDTYGQIHDGWVSSPFVEDRTESIGAPGVLGNDAGSFWSVELIRPARGTVTFLGGGSFRYTPLPDQYGWDAFEYRVCNASLTCDDATVNLYVINTDDPPVVADDTFVASEDEALVIPAPGVLANDSDDPTDWGTEIPPPTVRLIANPSKGTVEFRPDGSFTYEPSPDASGADTFRYEFCDTVWCSPGTVTIDIAEINDPPSAVADAARVEQYGTVTIEPLANDADVEGDALRIASVQDPAHGTATVDDDGVTLTFVADWSFRDEDVLVYTVSDGRGGLTEGHVTISEIACGEDGLDMLRGTPAEGTASGLVDDVVEPAIGPVAPNRAAYVHGLNCAGLVPLEDEIDATI